MESDLNSNNLSVFFFVNGIIQEVLIYTFVCVSKVNENENLVYVFLEFLILN